MSGLPGDVTQLLTQWRAGDDDAIQQLTPLLYAELRRVAAGCLGSPDRSPTLQPTALVHEFYLRASGLRHVTWNDRAHFVTTAAKVMRHIVVDGVRQRKAQKRGSGRVERLQDADASVKPDFPDLVALDRALDRLAVDYPRHARVVELMFFGGLNSAETAELLGAGGTQVSSRTVERDWRFARSWLHQRLSATT